MFELEIGKAINDRTASHQVGKLARVAGASDALDQTAVAPSEPAIQSSQQKPINISIGDVKQVSGNGRTPSLHVALHDAARLVAPELFF